MRSWPISQRDLIRFALNVHVNQRFNFVISKACIWLALKIKNGSKQTMIVNGRHQWEIIQMRYFDRDALHIPYIYICVYAH